VAPKSDRKDALTIQSCPLGICHLGFNFFALLSHTFPYILSCKKISFPIQKRGRAFMIFPRLCPDLLVVSYNNNRNSYFFLIISQLYFP